MFLVILPAIFVLLPSAFAGYGPSALADMAEYKSLRKCAQQYVYNGCCTIDVYEALGCPSPPIDSCLCREDLKSGGSSFLSKYVNSACSSNKLDLSAAIGVWDKYCSRGPEDAKTTTGKQLATTTTIPELSSSNASPGTTPTTIRSTSAVDDSNTVTLTKVLVPSSTGSSNIAFGSAARNEWNRVVTVMAVGILVGIGALRRRLL